MHHLPLRQLPLLPLMADQPLSLQQPLPKQPVKLLMLLPPPPLPLRRLPVDLVVVMVFLLRLLRLLHLRVLVVVDVIHQISSEDLLRLLLLLHPPSEVLAMMVPF